MDQLVRFVLLGHNIGANVVMGWDGVGRGGWGSLARSWVICSGLLPAGIVWWG